MQLKETFHELPKTPRYVLIHAPNILNNGYVFFNFDNKHLYMSAPNTIDFMEITYNYNVVLKNVENGFTTQVIAGSYTGFYFHYLAFR